MATFVANDMHKASAIQLDVDYIKGGRPWPTLGDQKA